MTSTTRKIGQTDVPPIGFGTMGLGTPWYGEPVQPDEERFKVLDAAYEQGCTHWDTADIYGDSEELLGKWFKRTGKRDEIFLATKFGIRFLPSRKVSGDPAYVKTAVTKSLGRLGVDHIDLLYCHRIDPTVPIELTVRAMAEFVKAGKVKYLGLSECSATALRRAHAVHPIAAIQIEYSPFALDVEHARLFETTKELGVTVVAYSPLGRGLLTGNYKSPDDFDQGDFRKTLPRFSKENFPKILSLVDKINVVAAKHNVTSGQAALAWVIAQADNIVAIPGTTKVEYLTENIRAAKVPLTLDDTAQIRQAAVESETVGGRYGESSAALLIDSPPLVE